VGLLSPVAVVARALPRRPVDLPEPTHDAREVRRAARRILARPEYDWSDRRPPLQRLAEWVAEQLSRLASPFGLAAVPTWVGWVVLGLVVALLGWLIYRSRDRWRAAAAPARRSGADVVVAAGEEAVDWPTEVARCEAEGRWREGLRARYRVLVGELAGRGVIPDLAGRTAGELAADVRRHAPASGPAFAAATALFEAAWYGDAPCGPGTRDRFAALAAAAAERAAPATSAAGRAPAPPVAPS
jgi:hypothetical protein